VKEREIERRKQREREMNEKRKRNALKNRKRESENVGEMSRKGREC